LKKLDHDKNVQNFINSNVKLRAPAPNGGIGGLVRDFRVDEEPGMSHAFDPRLAPKGPQSG
jgi:hypothetical protein